MDQVSGKKRKPSSHCLCEDEFPDKLFQRLSHDKRVYCKIRIVVLHASYNARTEPKPKTETIFQEPQAEPQLPEPFADTETGPGILPACESH